MRLEESLLKKCWFLAGPTAVGKTDTSLQLAERLSAEIVAMDSMTVYRHMDIGTAKASADERARVPHHMLDLIDPHQEYSVAQYVETAVATCENIVARGNVPLFVGGTGLFLRSLLRGVFDGPPANWTLRNNYEQAALTNGAAWLHNELRQRDPQAADRLHPNDQRRIIRAIEVVEATGQPLSAQQQHEPLPIGQRCENVFWLEPPRDWIYDRVNWRVLKMMDEGLVAEVRSLLERNPPAGRTARQGLGYKEVIEHLEDGLSLTATIEKIQIRTRQFAKRQHTWFRNLEECKPIAINGTESTTEIVDRLLSARA